MNGYIGRSIFTPTRQRFIGKRVYAVDRRLVIDAESRRLRPCQREAYVLRS